MIRQLVAFVRNLASPPPSVKLASFGLEAEDDRLIFRESRPFTEHGIATVICAEASKTRGPKPLSDDDLRSLGTELAAQARQALTQAEAAIRSLAELVLRPAELRRLGGEEQVRKLYLNLPATVQAANATPNARRLRKEALEAIDAARQAALDARLRGLTTARLRGKVLQQTYQESLPLLTTTLRLGVTVDKALQPAEAEELLGASDADLPATLERLLASSRRALLARIEDQLRQLVQRIRKLPHIELLTDAEIAETVEPYYGGLNRALKKHRAKSALVAVEERAREAKYQGDVAKFNEKRAEFADVASYYPLARTLQRQLVLYVGPTNSGKTWRALNDLAAAESGVYLAPLRLLALEGQEELEGRGRPTSFITGEERDLKPEARFISSTIEMLNLEAQVDAVVVDEVQLLADERRGWAWLAAVVGAPAKKIIMTGSPDCVELVKSLASYLGEELVIHECQRHNELRVAEAPMRLREIRPGMAIVCFSRRDVLRIKTMIQENSPHKVAVVYGNLSPQVRREEARRFRAGEADILVATDAIAMGLNLPINEVLFYTTEKFNGEEMCRLTPSEIRQIGGRAGRFGFAKFGVVNALDHDSLELIREAVQGSSEMLAPTFYIAPGHNHVRIISEVLGTTSLERILTFFDRAIEFSDARFYRSNIDDLSFLSTYVDERLPFLDVAERLTIACAPVAVRNEKVLGWFLDRMLPSFQADAPDRLDELLDASRRFDTASAKNQYELRDAEDFLKALTVYAWLAYRYPEVFTRIDECEERRDAVNAFIERSLRKTPEKVKSGEADRRGPPRRGRRRSRR